MWGASTPRLLRPWTSSPTGVDLAALTAWLKESGRGRRCARDRGPSSNRIRGRLLLEERLPIASVGQLDRASREGMEIAALGRPVDWRQQVTEETFREDRRGRIDALVQLRNLVGAHYNESAQALTDAEARESAKVDLAESSPTSSASTDELRSPRSRVEKVTARTSRA